MLKQFLKLESLTQADFAAKIGISTGYLSSLIAGRKTPSLEIAAKIERQTGGAVPASCWSRVKSGRTNSVRSGRQLGRLAGDDQSKTFSIGASSDEA